MFLTWRVHNGERQQGLGMHQWVLVEWRGNSPKIAQKDRGKGDGKDPLRIKHWQTMLRLWDCMDVAWEVVLTALVITTGRRHQRGKMDGTRMVAQVGGLESAIVLVHVSDVN